MITRYTAKQSLKRKGWTLAAASAVLGVHRVHLSYVLNGHRESRRLLSAIAALSKAPKSKKGAQ